MIDNKVSKAKALQKDLGTVKNLVPFLLCSILLVVLSACSSAAPKAKAPIISEFTASASTITAGEETTLTWAVTGTATIELSIADIGKVTGTSKVVAPTATTTYILTAKNTAGSVNKELTITVNPVATTPNPTDPNPTNPNSAAVKPSIASFTAAPSSITTGQSSTLSWNVTGTAPIELSITSLGTVTGSSKAVTPTATTTYTLTAKNTAGSVSKALTITVNPKPTNPNPTTPNPVVKPSIVSFTAAPSSITTGQSSTLSWNVTGTQPITISIKGLGNRSGTSVSVSPTATITYTLTAKNSAGSVTKDLTLGVSSTPTPPPNVCDDINIPDANLKAVLRNTTEIPDSGPITCADMAKLTGQIDASFSNITDVTGINYAVNLITLHINDNQIASIEKDDFAGLANLTLLDLSDNQIASIEKDGFAGLANLTGLDLGNNQIANIEKDDFAGLANLTILDLSDNQIASIEKGDFAGLANLVGLSLYDNQIVNIEEDAFTGLANLRGLGLNNNQITTITALQSFAHRNLELAFLDLSSNCLDLNKVGTKGIYAQLKASTVEFTATTAAANCPNPLPKQANSTTSFDLNATTYEETEAWTLSGGAGLSHKSSGGQSGGYIQAGDGGINIWKFKAPQQYYGDASDYLGGSLSYYLKSNTIDFPKTEDDIIMSGGGITLSYRFDPALLPTPSWTAYQVTLSHTGWKKGAAAASAADMTTVLSNLSSLEIRGEYDAFNNFFTGLDTVVMKTAP